MNEPRELTAGQHVASRYRVERVIDRGGMGVVYEAVDEQLGRRVALKVLSAETQTDPARLEQFRVEARTLSALNHPSIVTIHEVGTIGDTPFIAMELVEGQTLGTRLRFGPLALRDALDVGVQVARALAAAHEKGIIHRDIKPENLMIRDDGYVKVLDFGVAVLRPQPVPGQTLLAAATRGNATLVVAGTPAYMSPEQIESARIDARSDLFSLGVTLCEALTGTNPVCTPQRARHADVDRQGARAGRARGRDAAEARARDSAEAHAEEPRGPLPLGRAACDRSAAARHSSSTARAAGAAGGRSSQSRPRRLSPPWPSVCSHVARRSTVAGSARTLSRRSRSSCSRRSGLPPFRSSSRPRSTLPGDPELERVVADASRVTSIHTKPEGALVEVKDYNSPSEDWLKLGKTPLDNVRIPNGYLRWKVSDATHGEIVAAPVRPTT